MYIIPYKANFECSVGHRYVARVNGPFATDTETMCPTCYANWIAANVPNGRQIDKPVTDEDVDHCYTMD